MYNFTIRCKTMKIYATNINLCTFVLNLKLNFKVLNHPQKLNLKK